MDQDTKLQDNDRPSRPDLEFDYAWKWFEFHANQRTTMFNYFLLITGILANAFVGLLRARQNDVWGWAVGIGLLGAFTALAFLLLDIRNKQLLNVGEDELEKLEGTGPGKISVCIRGHHYNKDDSNYLRHKYLIPGVEIIVGLAFVASIVTWNVLWSPSANETVRVELDLKTLDAMRQLTAPKTTPSGTQSEQPSTQVKPTGERETDQGNKK